MDQKKSLVEKLRTFKKAASEDFPIRKMVFFGSRVSGKPRRYSDIDLLIVSPAFKGIGFRWRATKMYDYWTLRMPVDFLCYTPEEFRRLRSKSTIVKEAVETGIEIT